MLCIGLMTGTSLDAFDAALCEIDQQQCRFIAGFSLPYSAELKQLALQLCQQPQFSWQQLTHFAAQHAHYSEQSVQQLLQQQQLQRHDISVIGYHGQTLFHHPQPPLHCSIQAGNAAQLAMHCGIDVVSDFRQQDVALVGQGAPLVPPFHQFLFNDGLNHAVVNIGGIANVSLISPDALLGFDTGPGNRLLDDWIEQHQGASFDRDGAWAATGQVDEQLLNHWLSDRYFALAAPKSTGREYFNLDWLRQRLPEHYRPQDVQATLAQLTANSIAAAIKGYPVDAIWLCGGGALNQDLVQRLTAACAPIAVAISDERAISSQYMEAMAFAWLAYRRITQQTNTQHQVTGAKQDCCAGAWYQGKIDV